MIALPSKTRAKTGRNRPRSRPLELPANRRRGVYRPTAGAARRRRALRHGAPAGTNARIGWTNRADIRRWFGPIRRAAERAIPVRRAQQARGCTDRTSIRCRNASAASRPPRRPAGFARGPGAPRPPIAPRRHRPRGRIGRHRQPFESRAGWWCLRVPSRRASDSRRRPARRPRRARVRRGARAAMTTSMPSSGPLPRGPRPKGRWPIRS